MLASMVTRFVQFVPLVGSYWSRDYSGQALDPDAAEKLRAHAKALEDEVQALKDSRQAFAAKLAEVRRERNNLRTIVKASNDEKIALQEEVERTRRELTELRNGRPDLALLSAEDARAMVHDLRSACEKLGGRGGDEPGRALFWVVLILLSASAAIMHRFLTGPYGHSPERRLVAYTLCPIMAILAAFGVSFRKTGPANVLIGALLTCLCCFSMGIVSAASIWHEK